MRFGDYLWNEPYVCAISCFLLYICGAISFLVHDVTVSFLPSQKTRLPMAVSSKKLLSRERPDYGRSALLIRYCLAPLEQPSRDNENLHLADRAALRSIVGAELDLRVDELAPWRKSELAHGGLDAG